MKIRRATGKALRVFQNLPEEHKSALERYEFLLVNGKVDVTLFTCATCPVVGNCPSEFDPYNTSGDCLEMK